MTNEEQVCNCQEKELQQLKHELHKCKTNGEVKNQRIKKLDKKVFILMAICVAIGVILGKETLDSIVEWLETLNGIKSGVTDLTKASMIPSPGALALFGLAGLVARTRRRKR